MYLQDPLVKKRLSELGIEPLCSRQKKLCITCSSRMCQVEKFIEAIRTKLDQSNALYIFFYSGISYLAKQGVIYESTEQL
jgi:hypothetical protein